MQGRVVLAVDAARAPTWPLIEGSVHVRWVEAPQPFSASVLVRPSTNVVLLASHLDGSSRKDAAIRWVLERIAEGRHGFFVRARQ